MSLDVIAHEITEIRSEGGEKSEDSDDGLLATDSDSEIGEGGSSPADGAATEDAITRFRKLTVRASEQEAAPFEIQVERPDMFEKSVTLLKNLARVLELAFMPDVVHLGPDLNELTDVDARKQMQGYMDRIDKVATKFETCYEHESKREGAREDFFTQMDRALEEALDEINRLLEELKEKHSALLDCLTKLKKGEEARKNREAQLAEHYAKLDTRKTSVLYAVTLCVYLYISPVLLALAVQTEKAKQWFNPLALIGLIQEDGHAGNVALLGQAVLLMTLVKNCVKKPPSNFNENLATILQMTILYISTTLAQNEAAKALKAQTQMKMLAHVAAFVPGILSQVMGPLMNSAGLSFEEPSLTTPVLPKPGETSAISNNAETLMRAANRRHRAHFQHVDLNESLKIVTTSGVSITDAIEAYIWLSMRDPKDIDETIPFLRAPREENAASSTIGIIQGGKREALGALAIRRGNNNELSAVLQNNNLVPFAIRASPMMTKDFAELIKTCVQHRPYTVTHPD